MSKYAKVVNDVIVDALDDLATQVHPSLHDTYISVPDATQVGFVKDGKKWVAPVPVAADAPAPVVTVLEKAAFLRRFTRAERIALREAAGLDPIIGDFSAMLDLSAAVDLADPETVEALAQLVALGALTADRKAAILAG